LDFALNSTEMTTHQLVRANLDSARTQLAETLPHLTDEMLDWAPAPGMPSIHRIFMDIIATEQYITDGLRGLPTKTNEELDAPLLSIRTAPGLVKKLTEVRAETLQYLDGLKEAELIGPARNSDTYAKRLELKLVPVSEVLRYIARHESYHAGQVVTYLWARGDDPYSWASP